jgi:hypothetical protein
MSKPEFKVPATNGGCADTILRLRLARGALQAEVAALDAQIAACETQLINTLPADDAEGVVGKLAKAVIVSKTVPTVEAADWPKVYAFMLEDALAEAIKKGVVSAPKLACVLAEKGSFDLLQRRINNKAVTERWDANVAIPGIGQFVKKTVSVTKR